MPDRRRFLAALSAAALAPALPARAADGPVVFAAASLKTAMDEIATKWGRIAGVQPRVSYAGSAALARQIDGGAPAELFFSANVQWVDWLQERGRLREESRVDLLGNRLVVIGHGEGPDETGFVDPAWDLRGLLGGGRLALALTSGVPAGVYAKTGLETLGLWDQVSDRLAQADNVRGALALVARGEAPLGVVYATDAKAEPRVRVLGTFPDDSHPRIIYPAALTRRAGPQAERLLQQLSSREAAQIFAVNGFQPLAGGF